MEEQKRKIAKVEIDKKTCIGCGTCVVLSPDAFDMDNEGYSEVKESWKNLSDEELMNTARSCPSGSIILFDEEGNKINL
jgi:ferredoxin